MLISGNNYMINTFKLNRKGIYGDVKKWSIWLKN